MSDPINYFLDKFCEIWRDGKDARITLECHAGQAWISLHHRLGCPPPSSPQFPRRPPSPSRERRRIRRAHARTAAAQAELNPIQINDQVTTSAAEQTDKAVQTEMSKTVDATVQVENQEEQEAHAAPTEPLHDQHCPEYQVLPAEQARHQGRQHFSIGQAQPRQAVLHIESVRHTDTSSVLSNPGIPQFDGNISTDYSLCNMCQKVLETIDDYKWHYETKHGREDCRLLRSMLN